MSYKIKWILLLLLAVAPHLFASVPTVTASDGTYADKVHVALSSTVGKGITYQIYRNDTSDCQVETGCIKIYDGGSNAYDDTAVTEDTTYYYWGRTCSSFSGCSAYGGPDSGYSHLPIPPSTTVSASDGTYTSKVVLSITPSSGAASYQIYRSIKNSLPSSSYKTTTSTSFGDKGVTAGTTYYYWVKSCNTSGCSAASPSDSGYALAIPSASSINASDGTYTDKVVLSITPSSGAVSYQIYRSEKNILPATIYKTGASTTYNDTAVTPGTTYYYWVKACNSAGCSSVSASNSGYAAVPIPPKTSIDASDGAYTDKVALTMVPVSGATSYKIYRALAALPVPSKPYHTATSTTYNDTAVTPGTTYYYWVKACNSAGCSSMSTYNSGYAEKELAVPGPTTIAASNGTYPDKIILSIVGVDGAANYKIYRSKKNILPATIYKTATSTTYNDTAVTPGTTYYYWVKVCNSAGCSSTSPSDSGYTTQMIHRYSWPELEQNQYESLRDEIYPFSQGEKVVTGMVKLPFRVAGLGDSYGAGEGNPNVDGIYEEPWLPSTDLTPGSGEIRKAVWDDLQCNRSNRSGFHYGIKTLNNVALFNNLELSDLVDFYFKNYACSGATTDHILDTERTDVGLTFHNLPPKPSIEPQTQSMKRDVLEDGPYDAVLLSIGGNDVGFAPAIGTCALGNCTYNFSTDPTHIEAIRTDMQEFIDSGDLGPLASIVTPDVNMWAVATCVKSLTPEAMGTVVDNLNIGNDLVSSGLGIAWDLLVSEPIMNALKEPETAAIAGAVAVTVCSVAVDAGWFAMGTMLKEGLKNNDGDYLRRRYDLIETKLRDGMVTSKAKVNIVEYPNIFLDSDGEYCDMGDSIDEVLTDPFLAGITQEEMEWCDTNLVQPLSLSINNVKENDSRLKAHWNVVHLPKSVDHGICESTRHVNLNIEALRKQGEDLVPLIAPFTGGMVHPNDEGYKYEGVEIKNTMFPDIAYLLNNLSGGAKNLEVQLHSSTSTDEAEFSVLWDDYAKYETGYILKTYNVAAPMNESSIHPEDPFFEQVLDRDSTSLSIPKHKIDSNSEKKVVDFYVGTCQVSSNSNECDPHMTLYERVKYGPIHKDDYALFFEKNSVLTCDPGDKDVAIPLGIANSKGSADHVIVAWNELPREFSDSLLEIRSRGIDGEIISTPSTDHSKIDIPSLEEFLQDNSLEANFFTSIIYNEETYSTNCTYNGYGCTSTYIGFKPYASLPISYEGKKFVVAAKFCNLAGCSEWSDPMIVEYPEYEQGTPIQCNDDVLVDIRPDVLHPWDLVSQPQINIVTSPSVESSQVMHFVPRN